MFTTLQNNVMLILSTGIKTILESFYFVYRSVLKCVSCNYALAINLVRMAKDINGGIFDRAAMRR